MKRVFGHRHLGLFFRPLVEIGDGSLTYKGKKYSWDDVASVKSFNPRHDASALFLNWPRTVVTLNDGSWFVINGRSVEEAGVKNKVGFWSRVSNAYEDLLEIFKHNAT
jgi:hypothetical protein